MAGARQYECLWAKLVRLQINFNSGTKYTERDRFGGREWRRVPGQRPQPVTATTPLAEHRMASHTHMHAMHGIQSRSDKLFMIVLLARLHCRPLRAAYNEMATRINKQRRSSTDRHPND